MYVPENSLAVLIEGSGRDDSGHIGSGHSDTVVSAASDLPVGSDACDVDKRDFEAVLERPELVRASDVQG